MYPIIKIAENHLSSYHLINLIAIIAFAICLNYLIKRLINNKFDICLYISIIFIFGFLGAKIFYIFEEFNDLEIWHKISNIKNGYVLYGGLIFLLISSFLYSKIYEFESLILFDINVTAFCLSLAIGKIACLATGCCYGIPIENEDFGIIFTNNLCPVHPKNEPLFPIQIIDSLFALILFVFFLGIKLRNKIRNGLVFFLFCLLYPTYRFFSEIYRGDTSRGFIFNGQLSLSQLYSILILLVSIFILIIYKFKSNKTKNVSN